MKKLILICIIIIALTFEACNRNVADDDKELKYEIVGSRSSAATESEKSQAYEENLIKRMQATIELIDNVNEAVINIDSPGETEKTVDVLIITESGTQLTEEVEAGIINLVRNSISTDLTVVVNLKEQQRTD